MCYINILYVRMSVCMKYVVQKQASITGRKGLSTQQMAVKQHSLNGHFPE